VSLLNEIQQNRIAEIVKLHVEVGGYLKMTLDKAIRIGELLREQKAECGHGAFESWVRRNAPFNVRTAQRYMLCCHGRDRLKNDNVSFLNDAHKLLANTGTQLIGVLIEEQQGEVDRRFRTATPEMYADREIVVLTVRGSPQVCLALGPDWEHPYLETAQFTLSDAVKLDRSWSQEQAFHHVLEAYENGEAVCTEAGTWGNYFNPKADGGCSKHFVHNYRNGSGSNFWFKSGLEHRLPREAFKTDLSIIEVDPRTEEDKAEQNCAYLRRDVERQEKESAKAIKKLAKAEAELEQLRTEHVASEVTA